MKTLRSLPDQEWLPKNQILASIWLVAITTYFFFSFGLTAPNFLYTHWQPYLTFQFWMWEHFYNSRVLLSWSFGMIMSGLFVTYGLLINSLFKSTAFALSNRKIILIVFLGICLLTLSNNALSYDLFNYLFNAKMVIVYDSNPHLKTAVDFASDPWVRFMHNIHTPAPYGYGWTLLSLLPYSLGLGKLFPTWFAFKIFGLTSFGLLSLIYWHFLPLKDVKKIAVASVVLLNPLVLIEILANGHNDLWMMVPAMIALLLVLMPTITRNWPRLLVVYLSALLIAISVSIKLASIALIPIWVLGTLAFFHQNFPGKKLFISNWHLLASISLFIPLLTERSKYFLPWYLIWSFVWVPFIWRKENSNPTLKYFSQLWCDFLLILSCSAMFRYLPFLWTAGYEPPVAFHQALIVWVPAGVYIFTRIVTSLIGKHEKKD